MLPNLEATDYSYSFTAPTIENDGVLTLSATFTNTGTAFIPSATKFFIFGLIWDAMPGYPNGDLATYGGTDAPGLPVGLIEFSNDTQFGLDINETVSVRADYTVMALETDTYYVTIHADPFGSSPDSPDYYEGVVAESDEWDNIAGMVRVETAPGFATVTQLAEDVWQTGWNVSWYYGWGSGWNVGWYSGWGIGWYVGWSFNGSAWTYGWAYGWNSGWHYGWNVGWYVGWHYGWNTGWHQSWGWVAL